MASAWLMHTWWTYRSDPNGIYHWFNLAEAVFWLGCAATVWARYRRRRLPMEAWYALSFVAFAVTDLREAFALQTWLIGIKALNVITIVWLRARLRPLYPGNPLLP
jgi:hypothetical protein